MKGNKRSLIVFGVGGTGRVLIDELMSAGRSVLCVTNAVLEVGKNWQASCMSWPICLGERH